MCTDKQIEYIKKLATWKGKAIDFNDIKSKSVAEVATLIDHLKTLPAATVKKAAVKTETPRTDKIRFGLACKMALTLSLIHI